ncbi:PRD domain-containing protein, partial [Coprobacillus cateniformis]|nr:PRD domain-containing protein [Coprobacillus cateniformis]
YYEIANSFVKMMENEFYTQMNSDEIIFVMMFMISGHELAHQKKVVTLIAMHGYQGASSIAHTVRNLTHKEIIYGYDLPLDKSMSAVYEEFKQYIIDIHQGKGIILIYDMGSMRTMAESIMSETGIEIRFLEIPITLIGIASVNKANELSSLEETYDYLQEHFKDIQYVRKESRHHALVIISATQKERDEAVTYLHQQFDVNSLSIYTFSGAEISDIYNEISRISNQYQIIGIVSSYNLHLSQFPFLKLQELYRKSVNTVEELFISEDGLDDIFIYLQDQFHDINIIDLKEPLLNFLEELPLVVMVDIDDDQRIGLLIHMVCLVDKLVKQESPSVHFISSQIIISNEEMIRRVKATLKPLEDKVGVHISDTEVATIISIVKKQ